MSVPPEVAGWKKKDGVAEVVEGVDEAGVVEGFWPNPLKNGF